MTFACQPTTAARRHRRSLACLVAAAVAAAVGAHAPAAPAIAPTLAAHCVGCHGRDGEINGAVDLRALLEAGSAGVDADLLARVLDAVRDGEMPPPDAPPLADAARADLVAGLDGLLAVTAARPARTPLRRMTRFQYGNAVTDLLGLEGDLFALPECICRDISGYFAPASGRMPDTLMAGNRIMGKGQLIVDRLSGVLPFPQDPRAANGYDTRGDLLALSPVLMESFLELSRSIFASPEFDETTCGAWGRYFAPPDGSEPVPAAVSRRLADLLARAFRRPVDPDVLGRYVAYTLERIEAGDPFPTAMQAAAGAALASPRFLYLHDGVTTGPAPEPLDDHELAARLSFFLWSSIPDDELRGLADAGRLTAGPVLAGQADRMMDHPRMKRFCDAFAGQWLKVEQLVAVEPDPRLFPDFSRFGVVSHAHRASAHMMLEPLLVFETVFVENRPVTDLIHSDFTYRTPQLRQFIARAGTFTPPIDGPAWSETLRFERVPVTGLREGGVITTAAIMTMTSGPSETKPITRGKWVVETILNDPPPPPPGDVPPLAEAVAGPGLTQRQRFALHATAAACAGCHARIDPYGFALENYDPVGRWREVDGQGLPIDPSGVLFGSVPFRSVEELKAGLLAKRERFARAFAGHLLKYALGRELTTADRPALDRIVAHTAPAGHRLRDMLREVVLSEPFRTKFNPAAEPVEP